MEILIVLFTSLLFIYSVATTIDEEVAELLKSGENQKVIKLLERLTGDERQAGDRLINLARSYALEGDLVRSEHVLRENLFVHSTSSSGYVSLGKLLIHLNRPSEAVAILRQGEKNAIDLDTDASFFVIFGKALASSKENNGNRQGREEALTCAMRAEEIGSSDAMIEYELGMLFFFLAPPSSYAPRQALDMHMRGRKAFERSRQLNPSLDRRFVGKVFLHYQRFAWASMEFKLYLKDDSSGAVNLEVLTLLAHCEERMNNPQAAEQLYKQALRTDSSNPSVLVALGKLLLGLGLNNYGALHACGVKREEATGYLRRAVDILDHNDSTTHDPELRALHNDALDILQFCKRENDEIMTWEKIAKKQSIINNNKATTITSDPQTALRLRVMVQRIRSWFLRVMKTMRLILGIGASRHGQSTSYDQRDLRPGAQVGEDARDTELRTRVLRMREKWRQRERTVPHVDRVQVGSANELLSIISRGHPVIVSNLQDHWAFHKDKEKDENKDKDGHRRRNFSIKDAMMSTFGNHTVRVAVSASGRFDGPEDGQLWGLKPGSEVLVRPPTTSMRLSDFLTLSTQQATRATLFNHKATKAPKREKETFYIEYLSLQQYLGTPFVDSMVPLPPQLQALVSPGSKLQIPEGNIKGNNTKTAALKGEEEEGESPLSFLVSNLWVSSGTTTVSPLHYDDYENLLFQIDGEKEFLLFAPEEYPNLYYQGRPKGTLQYEFPATFKRDTKTLDKRSFVFASSVNVDQPDYTKHPKYRNTKPVRAHLHPGDVLFVPAFWHHEVQSLPSTPKTQSTALGKGFSDGLNVAMNVWCANISWPDVPGMM